MSKPFIETYSGGRFFMEDTDTICINPEDIAHALSHICRYTGHCKVFYSVAEHSYYASYLTDDEHAFEALMHDASEAYISDIAKPFKGYLHNYDNIESSIMKRIAKRFNLEEGFEHSDPVKTVDVELLIYEASHLMKTGGKDWGFRPSMDVYDILRVKAGGGDPVKLGMPPAEAKEAFLNRFNELYWSK